MTAFDPSELPASIPSADMQAFQRVFQAYLNPLRRYVYTYVPSWETAEDLVNDAFLQLWRRLRAGEPVRDLKAYLYTTARNLAINDLRRRRRAARHLEGLLQAHLLDRGEARRFEAEELVEATELAAALQRAVDMLPRRQREVIVLRWARGATQEEIAEALGIGAKTVSEHYRAALQNLRALLPDFLANPL